MVCDASWKSFSFEVINTRTKEKGCITLRNIKDSDDLRDSFQKDIICGSLRKELQNAFDTLDCHAELYCRVNFPSTNEEQAKRASLWDFLADSVSSSLNIWTTGLFFIDNPDVNSARLFIQNFFDNNGVFRFFGFNNTFFVVDKSKESIIKDFFKKYEENYSDKDFRTQGVHALADEMLQNVFVFSKSKMNPIVPTSDTGMNGYYWTKKSIDKNEDTCYFLIEKK